MEKIIYHAPRPERYNVNLLTIKRPKTSTVELEDTSHEEMDILGVLEAETKIKANDRLVVMGRHEDINKLIDTN